MKELHELCVGNARRENEQAWKYGHAQAMTTETIDTKSRNEQSLTQNMRAETTTDSKTCLVRCAQATLHNDAQCSTPQHNHQPPSMLSQRYFRNLQGKRAGPKGSWAVDRTAPKPQPAATVGLTLDTPPGLALLHLAAKGGNTKKKHLHCTSSARSSGSHSFRLKVPCQPVKDF